MTIISHMAHQTTRHHGHTGTAPQLTDGTHGGIHTNRSYPISQTLFERTKRDKQWMMKLEDCKIDNRVPRFRLPFCKNSKHFHFRFSDWRGYWRQTPSELYLPNQFSIRCIAKSFNSWLTVPLGVVVQMRWINLANNRPGSSLTD